MGLFFVVMKTILKWVVVTGTWLFVLFLARQGNDHGLYVVFLDMSAVGAVVIFMRWRKYRKQTKSA